MAALAAMVASGHQNAAGQATSQPASQPVPPPTSAPAVNPRLRSARTVAELFVTRLLGGRFREAAELTGEPLTSEFGVAEMVDAVTQMNSMSGRCGAPAFISMEPMPGAQTRLHYYLDGERMDLRLFVVVSPSDEVVGFRFFADERTRPWDPPDYASETEFREVEVTVGHPPWELGGTLTIPNGRGPFPGVVLVHGTGAHLRDQHLGRNRIFKDIAWGLATRGVAVLRYDKRTKVYGSAVKKIGLTVDAEVIDDALAALDLLRSHPQVDKGRTFLLGHTLGATLAPEIAERDGKLAGVIMLAPAAKPLLDVFALQTEFRMREAGDSPETQKNIEEFRDRIEQVKNHAVPPGEFAFDVGASYWYDLESRDGEHAVAAAQALACPILLLAAGRDAELTGDDFGIWEQALADRPKATLKRFDTLNQIFFYNDGPFFTDEYQTPGHVHWSVIQEIAEWIKSVPQTGS